ncbi:hypothetical protein [Pseudophaeobacter leonis]|uniref:hypothetical protein n=1 Tax=Pseudophaeobacter leonis TaxID=1144477 RepID=UPI0030C6606C
MSNATPDNVKQERKTGMTSVIKAFETCTRTPPKQAGCCAVLYSTPFPGPLYAVIGWGVLLLAALFLFVPPVAAQDVSQFVGRYSGSVEVVHADGDIDPRDMSVEISETRKGFSVRWTSITEKNDGRRKEKSYKVEFRESDRAGIFSAAMGRNVFGHEVQLDPMKGHPYVWARITEGTLTVFSLYIHQNGDYEMQQYDRSLSEKGLHLVFSSHLNGRPTRQLETELIRH